MTEAGGASSQPVFQKWGNGAHLWGRWVRVSGEKSPRPGRSLPHSAAAWRLPCRLQPELTQVLSLTGVFNFSGGQHASRTSTSLSTLLCFPAQPPKKCLVRSVAASGFKYQVSRQRFSKGLCPSSALPDTPSGHPASGFPPQANLTPAHLQKPRSHLGSVAGLKIRRPQSQLLDSQINRSDFAFIIYSLNFCLRKAPCPHIWLTNYSAR